MNNIKPKLQWYCDTNNIEKYIAVQNKQTHKHNGKWSTLSNVEQDVKTDKSNILMRKCILFCILQ